MSKIAQKLTDLIGNTPLLALNRYSQEAGLSSAIVAKLASQAIAAADEHAIDLPPGTVSAAARLG